MNAEFWEEFEVTQSSPVERPQVQSMARAIQESIPPAAKQRGPSSGLAYPYPGKGVSGESSN